MEKSVKITKTKLMEKMADVTIELIDEMHSSGETSMIVVLLTGILIDKLTKSIFGEESIKENTDGN